MRKKRNTNLFICFNLFKVYFIQALPVLDMSDQQPMPNWLTLWGK